MHLDAMAYECSYEMEETPEVGLWTNWLPRTTQVARLPTARNYFDLVL